MIETALHFVLISASPVLLFVCVRRLFHMSITTNNLIRFAYVLTSVGALGVSLAPLFVVIERPAMILFCAGTTLYILSDRRGSARTDYGQQKEV